MALKRADQTIPTKPAAKKANQLKAPALSEAKERFVAEPMVRENAFLSRRAQDGRLPDFSEARRVLPNPVWDANPPAITAFWRAWETAFANLRQPTPSNGFVSSYVSPAGERCISMWDAVFTAQFGRYGNRAFPFQLALDNFYAKQLADGFIGGELRQLDGQSDWHRHSPYSTGPEIFAWAEMDHFLNTGDFHRLKSVYSPLLALHRWMRKNRSWPNGSYWTTGHASAMENMPRLSPGCDAALEHGGMTWVDATFQAALTAKVLAQASVLLGRPEEETEEVRHEVISLTGWANDHLWHGRKGFYFDLLANDELSSVFHVGSFWGLLAGAVPPSRVEAFADNLSDPRRFSRHHRVPSLSAAEEGYEAEAGERWNGGVFPQTSYMVLRGLTQVGMDDMAFTIARNHLGRVLDVFRDTGALWTYYSPESSQPGRNAEPDVAGGACITPISVLIEYIFGLRPRDPLGNRLTWDIHLTDAFGIERYPLGPANEVSLFCERRSAPTDEPIVAIRATQPTLVDIRWPGGGKTVRS